MRAARKPPLANSSSINLRSKTSRLSTGCIQTPPGTVKESKTLKIPINNREELSTLRPEYISMSSEFQSLSRMVSDELGREISAGEILTGGKPNVQPMIFERGRRYEEYSAARNARLCSRLERSKPVQENKSPSYKTGLGVKSSLVKKRCSELIGTSVRRSLRKSGSTTADNSFILEATPNPSGVRRSLRKCASTTADYTFALEATPKPPAAVVARSTPRYMLRSMHK